MRTLLTAVAIVLIAAAIGACSSGGPSTETPIAVKDFSLDPTTLAVRQHTALAVTNLGPTIHNVTIRDASGTVLAATQDLRAGQSAVLPLPLAPGRYTLFCSLPGHESLGIRGTLTVSP